MMKYELARDLVDTCYIVRTIPSVHFGETATRKQFGKLINILSLFANEMHHETIIENIMLKGEHISRGGVIYTRVSSQEDCWRLLWALGNENVKTRHLLSWVTRLRQVEFCELKEDILLV